MTVCKREKFSKRGKSSDCNPLSPQNGWAVYLFSLKRKGNLISSWWHLCEKVDPWQRKTSNKNKRTMVGEVETICYSNTEVIICCAIKAWHLKGHLSNTGSCKLFQSPSLLSSVLVTQAHQWVHQTQIYGSPVCWEFTPYLHGCKPGNLRWQLCNCHFSEWGRGGKEVRCNQNTVWRVAARHRRSIPLCCKTAQAPAKPL